MIITTEGIIIRTSCDGISTLGRVTSGVKIINLNYDNNVKVASMTEVQKEEFDDEDLKGEGPEKRKIQKQQKNSHQKSNIKVPAE